MSASTIKITFTENLIFNDRCIFMIHLGGISGGLQFQESYRWVSTRTTDHQVVIGTQTINEGERAAINFVNAALLDIPAWFDLSVTRIGNEVTITASNINQFIEFSLTNIVPGISSAASIVFEIDNGVFAPFIIDSIGFSESLTPCSNVELNVETTELAVKILSPIVINPNTNNPFSFDIQRGQTFTLLIEDVNGLQISQIVQAPSILDPNNFQIQINNNPTGATIVINNTNIQGLTLEYSLDGSVWQTDNVFNSLPEDNYTLHVRDNYGCSFSKDFSVTASGIYLPYFNISKSNSLRFANRVTWRDSGNYKNDENTLSCEADVKNAFKQIQLFQTSDVITTQFKSNYTTNTVKVIKADLSEVIVPVVKKSNNIGLTDSRDGRMYDLGNGKTGVYFTTGNVYDFNTGLVVGDPHYLNGTLPYWGKAGNYIKIASAWFLIESVIYDENKNSDVIVFSNNYTSPDALVIVGSQYNKFDYEIYEFTIDMLAYMDENIRVKIELTDPNFYTINLISELINVKVRQLKTVEIDYWNDDNTDVFYSTGIRHKIRVLLTKKAGISEDENEVLKTDSTAVTLSSQLYELDQFIFEPLTKELWRKLLIALSCKNVIIDEVGYVKTESGFESEGPLEKSNLYVLKAKMIKKSGSFKSTSDGNAEFDYSNVAIPGLIDIGNDGFMKY